MGPAEAIVILVVDKGGFILNKNIHKLKDFKRTFEVGDEVQVAFPVIEEPIKYITITWVNMEIEGFNDDGTWRLIEEGGTFHSRVDVSRIRRPE